MKVFIVIIPVMVLILISDISALAAEGPRDGYTTGDDADSTTLDVSWIAGQTWTASSSYQLTYIEVYMRRVGDPGDLVLNIKTTTDGNPSGTELASVRLDASSIPVVNSWVRFDVPTSTTVDIEAGSVYWWGVHAKSGDQEGNYYTVRFDKENGYSGGMATNSSDGIVWTAYQNFDNLFQIYGEEPIITTITYTQVLPPITVTMTATSTITITESVTAIGDSTESESSLLFIIPSAVGGLLAGAVIWRMVAPVIAGKKSKKQQADKDKEEQEKPVILEMSCRIKNRISGEETYTERRLD